MAMATLVILLIFATAILAIWLLAQARSGQPEIATENRQEEDSGAADQASPATDDEAVGGVMTTDESATTTEDNSQDSVTEISLPESLPEPPSETAARTNCADRGFADQWGG